MAKKGESEMMKTGDSTLGITPEMQALYDSVGGGKENLEHVQNPYFTISTQGSRFKVGGSVIGNKGVGFTGHIMRIAHTKAFYERAFDPANPMPPDCASVGGISPALESPHKQCATCAVCPQNQWGTGHDAQGNPSRGKACKEARRLVLHVPGIDLACNLSVPPTSLKDVDSLLKTCSTLIPGGIPVWAAKIEFGFDESKSYPRPTLQICKDEATGKPILVTSAEEFKRLMALRTSDAYLKAEMAYASAEEVGGTAAEERGGDEPAF